jgi:hypothetical protein
MYANTDVLGYDCGMGVIPILMWIECFLHSKLI